MSILNRKYMKIQDVIKLYAILLMMIKDYHKIKEHVGFKFFKNYIENNSINYLLFSGLQQLIKKRGLSIENPINDISIKVFYTLLDSLELEYKRLKSDYSHLKQKYIVDRFEVYFNNQNVILYHKIHTSDVNKNKISTGVAKIDKSNFKIKIKDIVLIAGRPSMGTSSFLNQIILESSQVFNIFILTNDEKESIQKLETYKNGFSNRFYSENIQFINIETKKFKHHPLHNCYNGIVIIDNYDEYENLMDLEHLKEVAKNQFLTIIIGCSLNNSVEKNKYAIPTISSINLKNKEQLKYIDKIILLRRPFYYSHKTSKYDISLYIHYNKSKQTLKCKLEKTELLRIR